MAYHIDKKRCHGIKAKIVHDTNRPYECVFPSSESRRMQERILGMDVVEIRVAEGYGELIVREGSTVTVPPYRVSPDERTRGCFPPRTDAEMNVLDVKKKRQMKSLNSAALLHPPTSQACQLGWTAHWGIRRLRLSGPSVCRNMRVNFQSSVCLED